MRAAQHIDLDRIDPMARRVQPFDRDIGRGKAKVAPALIALGAMPWIDGPEPGSLTVTFCVSGGLLAPPSSVTVRVTA